MRCIYCDSPIDKISLKNLINEEDQLCLDCRNKLKLKIKYIDLGMIKVETLYNYDSFFKDLLIQYKECFDEALADVFIYGLSDYIRIKYFGYKLIYVPSSKEKLDLRGFNHLEKMCSKLNMNTITGLKMKQNLVQEGKNYHGRTVMINNYIYEGEKLNKVLIIDDVVTTGSSILGVYKAIKPYAKKVKALSFSRKENAFIFRNKCDKIIK